jgi:MiaB/RimO family radical SAM methylthiotransferase
MNVNDSDIVRSVLQDAGLSKAAALEDADVILANTCAIRENAEQKIWQRLKFFNSIRRKKKKNERKPVVGVLGCMAERLKEKMFARESGVNFIAGPDAYRDIPRLIDTSITSTDQRSANTQLSLEETYADVTPVREASSVEAFVSVMRGCNNMCSFCIVPFTRGRERSRPVLSIHDEIDILCEQGVKEVLLLGQNVNSYHDKSEDSVSRYTEDQYNPSSDGFRNTFRLRDGAGARFADLLEEVSSRHQDMRFRFTSPHPKDFPDEMLQLIRDRTNICSSLHMPAQSGSTTNLERMRRGYSKEAYLDLIDKARDMIPGLSISTDIIAGFCGETEEEHRDTVDLMKRVRYDQAFMFAYSLREKTHAARRFEDNVPDDVKGRRLQEIIDTFRTTVQLKNEQEDLHKLHCVLIEGEAKKPLPGTLVSLNGRTDTNKRVIFPNIPIPGHMPGFEGVGRGDDVKKMATGEYVVVEITEVKGHTLRGNPIAKVTMDEYCKLKADGVVR